MTWQWVLGILGVSLVIWRLCSPWYQGRQLRAAMETAIERFNEQDWAGAEIPLRKVLRIAPAFGTAHRLLGVALARQGKMAEAETALRMAVNLEPRNALPHVQLGLHYATAQPPRPCEAIDALEQAVAHDEKVRQALKEMPGLEALQEHERFRNLLGPPAGE